MKHRYWLTGLLISLCALAEAGDTTRILFGSCIKQQFPVPIFDTIVDQKPDAFVFLGDNIYADTTDLKVMKAKYDALQAIPGFQKLESGCRLLATWDDHDYGVNDGGAEYEKRADAQKVFLDFWKEVEGTERRKTPGVYDSVMLGEAPRRVQVVLLDTRYFRGPLKKGERRVGGPYYPQPLDAKIPMLGEAQWQWLEAQLKVPAEIRIVASSIQFVSEAAGQETWSNLPAEKNRFIDLIKKTGANGLFFISGDRHWADVSAMQEDVPYPIYDFTSSALNQIHKRGTPTDNRFRIANQTFHRENYGQIDISWQQAPVEISVSIRDIDGHAKIQHSFDLNHLKN